MLNLARIPGWTWIFVAIALIMGSALIVGAAIERRRNRIKMVKRASAYKRQLIFNRALVAGLVMSLLVALVGCASGGGVTVEDSESSGFLPSTAEPAPQEAEPEGTEPAAEEADPNALSKVSMTFDTTGVDFETLYKEAFGDRKPTWANTSFTTRLPIRFDLSGYQDPFGFPIYADHDWLNGEYYQSLSDQIAERKIISFDYLGTSESLKRRTELLEKQNSWREAFEETLTDEERIERVNEMRTQENLENILFTVMAFDALTEHEVFRKNNEEAIKAFEEFLEDIYDPEAEEVSEDQAVGLPRLAEWEDGYEPTGDALQDMEHIVPSKNALKLKVFVQQLLTLDQETNGKIVTRKPSYYWTLEYSDNEKENATNPLLPSSSGSEEELEKTKKLPENFLRAVKKDGVEARNYIMYNVVRDGKTIFSYGIGVEDMSIAFFTSGKTSKTTTPTTPAPATKTYSARVQHRWADGRPGPGYPAIPFGDYYVNGLVTGSNFSYTAPIYPGCTVSLTAINVTVEDHDLLYTIYYTAPKDRQKSSGGGSGSKWKPNPKPNPKPDQNPNPEPENPTPKPDGKGGKTPTVSTGGPGVVPDTKGPGENIEGDKDGGGQTVNIPNETAKNEDYTVTEDKRDQQLEEEQQAWADQGKGDSSGTGGQDHEVGGQLTADTAQKTEETGQTPSINVSGGTPATSAGENSSGNSHYNTSQTVNNGDGTITTIQSSVNTGSGSMSSGMASDDDGSSSQQSAATASAGTSQQSSAGSTESSSTLSSGKASSDTQSNTASASSQGTSSSNSAGSSSAPAASSSTGSSSSGASSSGGNNTESSNGGAGDNGGSSGGTSSGMVSD